MPAGQRNGRYLLFIYDINRTKVPGKNNAKRREKNKKQKTPHTVHILFTVVCTSDLRNPQGSAAQPSLISIHSQQINLM